MVACAALEFSVSRGLEKGGLLGASSCHVGLGHEEQQQVSSFWQQPPGQHEAQADILSFFNLGALQS